jgi:hypothetical protein
MKKIVPEIKQSSNNQKRRYVMKRFTVCLSVFVLALFFLSVSALAKTPNRLEIANSYLSLNLKVCWY